MKAPLYLALKILGGPVAPLAPRFRQPWDVSIMCARVLEAVAPAFSSQWTLLATFIYLWWIVMSKEKPLMPASKVKLKGSCFLAKLKSFLEYKVKPFYNIHCKYIRCKNTLFTCVLKAHVLPLYFLHQNKCKFYIRLNAIFYTGINAIFTRNKCNFYTWINVFTSMYIYSNVKITFIHV